MADGTKIEWTDATWNPITGCSVVSPGCTNCYAMRLAGTRLRDHASRAGLTKDTKAGPVWTGEIRFNREWLDQPLRWKSPRMIFVAAHGDLFAEGVTNEQLDQIFAVMALSSQHIFQVLTKRPERMRGYLLEMQRCFNSDHIEFSRRWGIAAAEVTGSPCAAGKIEDIEFPLPNIWLGVSVEDQPRAEERIPVLLETPAAVHWVSTEPLLGLLDLTNIHQPNEGGGPWWFDALDPTRAGFFTDEAGTVRMDMIEARAELSTLNWVVAGGESGPDARPMHPYWAKSLRDQCAAAGVPFLFKQWGNWIVASHENGHHESSMATNDAIWLDVDGRQAKPSCDGMAEPIGMFRVTKSRAGRLLDGVEHNEFPPSTFNRRNDHENS
ncbi:phage Gp37/Gp68 family protein [Agrobacterium rhizogenes]|nr:phage Gp37/Gp68 family protein [Rhizobium rhizogenes]